jgi:phosphate-selective porin O/P
MLCLIVSLVLPQAAMAWEFGNLRLRGRLQTRFEVKERVINQDETEGWVSGFRIKRARIDGRWDPLDWARLVLESEFAGSLDFSGEQGAAVQLKDAYGRFKVHPALMFRVGYFKKPFSRLKMTSPFELFLPVRGLLNEQAVTSTRHGGFGGRDVGAMVSGKFLEIARLRYYLGVFSGPRFIDGIEESNKDFVGRIQVRPFSGLRVAISASHKMYHFKEGATLTGQPLTRSEKYTANLFGADARYKIENFTFLAEGAFGDNVNLGPGHLLWGFHATAAYAVSLGDDLVLTPAVMLELFDPSDQDEVDPAIRLAEALNLDIDKICRLIVYAETAWGEVLAFDPDLNNGNGGFVSKRPATRFIIQVNLSF